jgi:hypothetical protein
VVIRLIWWLPLLSGVFLVGLSAPLPGVQGVFAQVVGALLFVSGYLGVKWGGGPR